VFLTVPINPAPRRPELHAALGESYFMVGKVDQALQEFQTLLQLQASAQSFAYMGLAYRDLGKYDEAKQFLEKGLQLDGNDPVILYNLGYIAKRQGDAAAADRYLTRAIQLDPKYGQALFELGSLKVEEKKYDEAVPLLRRCAATSNSPAQAYYKLAIAERNMHQLEASQRDMKVFETLSKNPQVGPYPLHHVFDYLDRRDALSPEQREAEDLQSLEAKAKAHPDWPRNWHLLAEAYLKAGRLQDALDAFARLDSLSSGDIRTLLGEGVLLARYRFYPQAVERLQKALTTDPSSDEALYDLAMVYAETRDYANASAMLERLSPAARKGNDFLALLANVDAHQDRVPQAIQSLQQAVLNSPDDDRYYFLLGLTEMRAGQPDKAYTTLQRGLARVPDSAALNWGLGIISVARNNTAEAESYLKKSLALMPSREGPYLTLGMFYFEAGRVDEARQVFQQYTSAFPHPSMDVTRIRQTLDSAQEQTSSARQGPLQLSSEARNQFCQLALSLADFDHP
jgi:tetratricopeptide (TPR) repeat protein